MSAEGIEPSTNGLKGRCSAIELRARGISEGHSNMGGSERQRKQTFFTAKHAKSAKGLKIFFLACFALLAVNVFQT